MDIFFYTILSGFAVVFFIGLIEALLDNLINTRWIRNLGTVPLAGYGCWLLGVTDYSQLAVCTAAASFVALSANMLTRRPSVEVVAPRRRGL